MCRPGKRLGRRRRNGWRRCNDSSVTRMRVARRFCWLAVTHCRMFRRAGGRRRRRGRWNSCRRFAVTHCCVLRRAGGGKRGRRSGRQLAVAHGRMLCRARRSGCRCRRFRCRHLAVSHRGVLRRTLHCGGQSWRRRQLAMTHRGMLGRAGGRAWRRRCGRMAGVLGHSGGCNSDEEERQESAGHAFSPSSGRTVTTRIMPACMW